jgi:beta-galactosidase
MPDTTGPIPPVVYGAVYFRKSNPPRPDWPRDYEQAAKDGMNLFRHWFMWSAIEVAPGTYEWEDYDRQLDLAAEHGIGTVIAEQLLFAPEWTRRRFHGCELRDVSGQAARSVVSGSAAVGGYPGLCLDHAEFRDAAEGFLIRLAERYRDHPGLSAYDLWNECNIPERYCYCDATVEEFRRWLAAKYSSLRDVGEAWNRYSFASWEDVQAPADRTGYPEYLDWLQFRVDHAYERLRWRVQIIRNADPNHRITAHGIAGSLIQHAGAAADDWRAAQEVESYGLTWVASRKGNEAWKQWSAIDLVRCAARGKDIWHAEAQGGPLWMQPQVLGRPREDGRVADAADVRLWNLVSFAAGVRGFQFPRWRPLLDGPLFGAFGPYGMDGRPTDRSDMASRVATWATGDAQRALWSAHPVRGEIGLVWAPETQMLTYVQDGSSQRYAESVWGAYRGFFERNIQADYVHLDDIDAYRVLYLPMPFALGAETAARLARWVQAGGILISEGCPAYFDDRGHVSTVQPGGGLDTVFGAHEGDVEFTPDLLATGVDTFTFGSASIPGAVYRQSYEAGGATPVGHYPDGSPAVVEASYGAGRTLLVGTAVGAAHYATNGGATTWFAAVLDWAGIEPHVRVSDAGLTARLHAGPTGRWLWVTNPTRTDREATIEIGSTWPTVSEVAALWGDAPTLGPSGHSLAVRVAARDGLVVGLGS